MKSRIKIEVANFVRNCLPKGQRSLIARLRNGSLQLRIEYGRSAREPRTNRVCELCNKELEDAEHFLYRCEELEGVRGKHCKDVNIMMFLTIHMF